MTGTKIVLICFGIILILYIIGYIKYYPDLRKDKQSQTVIIIQQEGKE